MRIHPTLFRSFLIRHIAVMLMTLVFLMMAPSPASAQDSELSAADRDAVLEQVTRLLNERYVFPKVAANCEVQLREEVDAGAFDDITDPETLAAQLTTTLRSVSQDKHILVRMQQFAAPSTDAAPTVPEHPLISRARRHQAARQINFGFESVSILDGNIGYLDLRHFSGHREARNLATAAMSFLSNTDALIFDMRQNGGGDPDMVRYLCSYLFDAPTHLNSLYWREGDRTDEFWTIEVPGRVRGDVPVFVLTSSTTFSGAEEFCYNLQTRKRATLVGETTRGGANPGRLFRLPGSLEIFVPTGRAVNPITGTNWEGTGVTPDVEITADGALDAAVELAAPKADQYRQARATAWDDFDPWHVAARELDDDGEADAAARAVAESLRNAHRLGLVNEGDINQYGYEFLGERRHAMSIAAFELNVEFYPESANTYDSLGEACRASGQVDRAIQLYSKALELEPDGPNSGAARAILEEIRSSGK